MTKITDTLDRISMGSIALLLASLPLAVVGFLAH